MAGILSLQFEAVLGDKQANLEIVEKFIEENSHKNLDLVVLPEFFSTGVCEETFKNGQEDVNGGETIKQLSDLAKKYKTNIACGTVIERDGDKSYNTMFVVDRGGQTVAKYRKIHLFNYLGGSEGRGITAGETPVVIDLDFARVGLSICFDIRYPLLYRKLIQMGAEVIVSPSAWCCLASEAEKEAKLCTTVFEALNVARATENLVYFVTSNACGENGFLTFTGSSMVTHPLGKVLQNALGAQCALFEDINLDVVRNLKKTYPVAYIE